MKSLYLILIGLSASICAFGQSASTITIGLNPVDQRIGRSDTTAIASQFGSFISNLIDELPQGTNIILLEGDYPLQSASIQLKKGQSLSGQGPSTRLIVTENLPAIELLASHEYPKENIRVHDLQVQINNFGHSMPAIVCKTVVHDTEEVILQNNQFMNLKFDFVNTPSVITALHLETKRNGWIRDNSFYNFEIDFNKPSKAAHFFTLVTKWKIRDNDINNINIKEIGNAFEPGLIQGCGIQIETAKKSASVLNNTFSNIKFPPLASGIILSIGSPAQAHPPTESWINNNRFTDLYFEGYVRGIDFKIASVGIDTFECNRNIFRDLILQTKEYSHTAINNVVGTANSFVNCHIYDWHNRSNPNVGHAIKITEDARYTLIMVPRTFTKDVEDMGKQTFWMTNGNNSSEKTYSKFAKTGQLQLFDEPTINSAIKAKEHNARIRSKQRGNGNEILFETRQSNGNFKDILRIDENNQVIVHKTITLKEIPDLNVEHIIISDANGKLGKISVAELKTLLGGTGYIEPTPKSTEELLVTLQSLESEIQSLRTQINAQ